MKPSLAINKSNALQNLSISVGLLLIFALTRFHQLDVMPVFYDEAIHIRWAKMVWIGQLWTAIQDGRLLHVWWIALFWPFTGALWLTRAATLLPGLVGLAAVIATARLLGAPRSGQFAVGLYILLPVAFLYDRMIMADTMHVALVALLTLVSMRLVLRQDWWAAAVAGCLMFALFATKISGIYWIGAPLLAILLAPARSWRQQMPRLAAAYGIFGVLWLGTMAFVRRQGLDFGLGLAQQSTSSQPSLARLFMHVQNLLALITTAYLPVILLLVIVAGVGLALWRRSVASRAFMIIILVPWAGVSLTVSRFEPRFLIPALPTLALLVALGWDAFITTWPRLWQLGGVSLLGAAILASGSAQFMHTGWTDPLNMALPPSERDQYLVDWSAGTGVPEVAAYILSASAQAPTDLVVVDIGQIIFISTYLGPEPSLYSLLDYAERDLRIKVLYEGLDNPYASLADPCRQTFLLVKSPDDDHRLASLSVPSEKIVSIPRLDGKLAYDIYRVYPTEEALAVHAPEGCEASSQGSGN